MTRRATQNQRRYKGHTKASQVKVINTRTGVVVTRDAYTVAETRRIVGRAGRGKDP